MRVKYFDLFSRQYSNIYFYSIIYEYVLLKADLDINLVFNYSTTFFYVNYV